MKVGDYVETCHLLPGILEKIDDGDVEVYQMQYDKLEGYSGGSCCSIRHCGVHVIDKSFFDILMAIGHDKLSELWKLGPPEGTDMSWEEGVKAYHAKNFKI